MAPISRRSNPDGFTLIEILLALTIVGIVVAFAIGLSGSITNMGKVQETRSRMEFVAKKVKEYYRSHHGIAVVPPDDFPAVGYTGATAPFTLTNEVPVQATELNIDQKYRLDSWGQYLYYHFEQNQAAVRLDQWSVGFGLGYLINYPIGSKAAIRGVTVDGKTASAVLISGGPDQQINSIVNQTTYTTTGDDIVIPIDVHEEAVEIALEEANELNVKAKAFDAAYQGVSNDPDSAVDEDACVVQTLSVGTLPPNPGTNDPNCGTVTLDYIKANQFTGTLAPTSCAWDSVVTNNPVFPQGDVGDDVARAFMYCHYGLADDAMVDPWLNGYVWGCGSGVSGATICGAVTCENGGGTECLVANSDARFHKFYSAGPDGIVFTVDDIIP